jgi:hypothetical protein
MGNLLSAGQYFYGLHYDLFGSVEEEQGAPNLILRRGRFLPRAFPERAPLGPIKVFLSSVVSFHTGVRVNPSSCAVMRPVAIRQRSTAKRRASATMAFLRAPPEPAFCRMIAPHFFTARYWGW